MSRIPLIRLSVAQRVYGGFGLILLLLAAVGTLAVSSLDRSETSFTEYRTLARQSVAIGLVDSNVLRARIQVKNYVISKSQAAVEGFEAAQGKAIEYTRVAMELVSDAGRHELLEKELRSLDVYGGVFSQVVERQAERDQLVKGALDVIGPRLQETMSALMTEASRNEDGASGLLVARGLETLMVGRLHAAKFLIDNTEGSYSNAVSAFEDMDEMTAQLAAMNLPRSQTERLAAIRADLATYRGTFDRVRGVIDARNSLIANWLDTIGPAIADRIEGLQASIKARQDAIGPETIAAMEKAKVTETLLVDRQPFSWARFSPS